MRHLRTYESAGKLYFEINRDEWVDTLPKSRLSLSSADDTLRSYFRKRLGMSRTDYLDLDMVDAPKQCEPVSAKYAAKLYNLAAETVGVGPRKPCTLSLTLEMDPGERDPIRLVAEKNSVPLLAALFENNDIEVYEFSVNRISTTGISRSPKVNYIGMHFVSDDWVMLFVGGRDILGTRGRYFRCDGIEGVKQCLVDLG